MVSFSSLKERLHGGSRFRRILHGAASAFAGKGVSLLVGLVTVPITLHYLGTVRYGIWVTISSTVLLLGVLDLGIASTLTNYIAKSNASDDRDAARSYYATAFYITIAIACLLAAVCSVVWVRVPWGSAFGVTDPLFAHEAAQCVGVALLFFLLNLPLALATRVLSGYQQIQIANYFAMIGSVATFVAIIAGIHAHAQMVSLMMLFCAGMLTGNLCLNLWLVVWNRPWIRPTPSAVRMSYVQELFGEGIRFFVLQLSGLVVFNSDNLVITHFRGAAEVTPYSVTARLMSCAVTLHTLLIPVLWPAFSDAFHRGDLPWLTKTYNRIARLTVLLVTCVATLFALFGQWVIRAWAGTSAVPPRSLLWAMAAWVVILTISTNQSCLLAATRRIGLQAITSSIAAAFNLGLSIYLVKPFGALGVIVASIISYLLFVIAPQRWEVRNILLGKRNLAANDMLAAAS